MDNDNKIKANSKVLVVKDDSSKTDVELFLRDELQPLRQHKVVTNYDLEKEYAKTRKNKAFSVWITLFLVAAGVVAISWWMIKSFTETSKDVEVSLEAFEDLNLRNLFDALSKTQDLYEKATKAKAEFQAALDQKLTHAKNRRDSDLEYLRRLKLNRKNLQERENKVRSVYSTSVANAHAELDDKIAAADLELKQYEEQLKSFDSEHVEKAQEWERQMDSERQFYELEKARITEEYETQLANLKKQMQENQEKSYQDKRRSNLEITNVYESRVSSLDPVIKDSKVNNVINKTSEMNAFDSFDSSTLINSATYNDEKFSVELENARRRYDEYMTLNSYAKKLPYTNGMSSLIMSEQKVIYNMLYSLASSATNAIDSAKKESNQLSQQLTSSQNELASVKSALGNSYVLYEGYANSQKVDGLVLSGAEAKEVVAFFRTGARATIKNDGSTRVAILNNQKEKVATGAVWFRQNVYYISIDEESVQLAPGYFVKFSK